jgi:hypothetical protein
VSPRIAGECIIYTPVLDHDLVIRPSEVLPAVRSEQLDVRVRRDDPLDLATRPGLDLPPNDASPAAISAGKALFHPHCSSCHGDAAVSGGFMPDLRDSPALLDARVWRRIVYDGELQSRGMVGSGRS